MWSQRTRVFLLGLLLGGGILVGSLSMAATRSTATTPQSAYQVTSGVEYAAQPGPQVSLRNTYWIANNNSFPQPNTVFFQFANQGVGLSVISSGSPSVDLWQVSNQAVNVTLAASQPTEFDIANSKPVVVGPQVSQLTLSTQVALSDQTTDFAYAASSPAHIQVHDLRPGVRVRAIGVNGNGSVLANGTVSQSGVLSLTLPSGTHAVGLEAVGAAGSGSGGLGGFSLFGIHLSTGLMGVLLAILGAAGYYVYTRYIKGSSKPSKSATSSTGSKQPSGRVRGRSSQSQSQSQSSNGKGKQ